MKRIQAHLDVRSLQGTGNPITRVSASAWIEDMNLQRLRPDVGTPNLSSVPQIAGR
jgi:hypothetical protein